MSGSAMQQFSAESISVRARYVLPVAGRPMPDCWVSIRDGLIQRIGDRPGNGRQVDLGNVALIPGLINAHTHLELSDVERPLGHSGNRLADWVPLVLKHRFRREYDMRAAVTRGIMQCIDTGTVAVGDIVQKGWSPDWFRELGLATVAFFEMLGQTPDRIQNSRLQVERFLDSFGPINSGKSVSPDTPSAQLGQPLVIPGISPHAPHSTAPELVRRSVELAQRHHVTLAMHLAETREELQLLAELRGPLFDLMRGMLPTDARLGLLGTEPLDYLKKLAEAPRALVIHGNYLTDPEIDFIADRAERMFVCYCPRSHAWFGHDRYPLQQMLDSGITVALGTDSLASCEDLDFFQELRYVVREFPSIPRAEVLRLGTQNGARALGLDHVYGTIEPGKSSRMAVVRFNDPLSDSADPFESLFDADHARPLQSLL